MKKTPALIGHLACLCAYLIFGLNIIFCKNIALTGLVSPIALFCFRAIGATALFWLVSLFSPKEKMTSKDLVLTFFASMLGLFITQMSFLKAITMTTSIDASIMSTLGPILTMFAAAVFLKEPITAKKIVGVLISLAGVVFLILNCVSISSGADHTSPMGLLLMFCNIGAFSLYLGIFRPLIARYSVITFMKWMFLFSMVASLPFGFKDLVSIPYSSMEPKVILWIGYVVVFATFIAYFLVPVGQKHLRPTIVSMYNYVQPIMAMVLSIVIGLDSFSWLKGIATLLVFVGVGIVNRSKAAQTAKA